jgi:UDP-glucose 4-epimerase
MKILVTGGAGYIGSHTCVELLEAGYEVAVVDNLVNSSAQAISRVARIAGRPLAFYPIDVCDRAALETVFKAESPDAVIHFAGLKAVGESVEKPLAYYRNNLDATLSLCETMGKFGVKRILFSSSATVYGDAAQMPIAESCPKGVCTNPYGWTKWMIEQILTDLTSAQPDWQVTLLRYFNPIGAHPSGLIGEDPRGIPNNLLPYVAQVAVGKLPYLRIFGDDYPTVDGTGVRDYLHVVDLARGHVMALAAQHAGVQVYNLGTGRGSSVLEVVRAFEQASGRPVPYRIAPRRPGDVAENYCDPSLALRELGWKTQYDLHTMCVDAWNWQRQNPDGYPENAGA